jgi:hypothetical protein
MGFEIKNKELLIAWLGTVGYLLSALGYIARVFTLDIYTAAFLYGTLFVTLGYGLLFIFNVKEVASIKKEESRSEAESKKTDDKAKPDTKDHKEEKTEKTEKTDTTLLRTGYFFLFLFFAGTHLFPSLTERVRYYDIFASGGYLLNMLTDYITFYIPIVLLLIYYICGSYQKILDWKESGINKLQFISRSILVVYYGLHLLH